MFKKAALFMLVGLFLLISCTPTSTPSVVKLVVSLPMNRESGKDFLRGIEMALQESNYQANLIKVELIALDSSDPDRKLEREAALEVELLNKYISDQSVIAFIGATNSSKAKAVIPVANRATPSLVIISGSATWPGLTKPGYAEGEPGMYYPTGKRNFFRVVPSDDVQGLAAAKWVSQLGAKKVYVVSDGAVYSEGISNIFTANAVTYNLEILAHDKFVAASATPEDLEALVAKIVSAAPEVLYYPINSHIGATQLIGAVRKAAPNIIILSGDALLVEVDSLAADTNLFEGIYATNVVTEAKNIETGKAFLAKFESTHQKQPLAFTLSYYEATKVFLRALETAKTPTREGLTDALNNLGAYSGVLGTWQFDKFGDTTLTTVTGMQFQGGKWVPVTVID